MSITDMIPAVRRRRGKHHPTTVIRRLRSEKRELGTLVCRHQDHGALLQHDLNVARKQQAEAEELVVQLQADKDELIDERDQLAAEVEALRAELAPHRAAEANANAIDVPPMERDTTDGADQATAPAGIDVRPLWDAHGISPVVRVSTDGASADPAETLQLPKVVAS